MLKRIVVVMTLLAAAAFATVSMAADPTIHQVYQAAQAGKLGEAQAMMKQVLQDHPNSAKAHFVEAELLARQGRLASAESELNTAEHLAPGLPFAKPQAIQELRNRLHGTAATMRPVGYMHRGSTGLPWGMLFIGVGVIALIVLVVRSMNRNNAVITPVGGGGRYYGNSYPSQPYGGGGMAAPMGQTGGGLGSSIVGSLATGAAMGAGIVAGEALMHHFTDGNGQQFNPAPPADNSWSAVPEDDMGGNDFGISDDSSWDDGGGSLGDDWDS